MSAISEKMKLMDSQVLLDIYLSASREFLARGLSVNDIAASSVNYNSRYMFYSSNERRVVYCRVIRINPKSLTCIEVSPHNLELDMMTRYKLNARLLTPVDTPKIDFDKPAPVSPGEAIQPQTSDSQGGW